MNPGSTSTAFWPQLLLMYTETLEIFRQRALGKKTSMTLTVRAKCMACERDSHFPGEVPQEADGGDEEKTQPEQPAAQHVAILHTGYTHS